MDISTLGIDLSKTTFHVIGFNALLRRSVSFFRVCETNQCVGERSQPALLKPAWE